ncbi:heme A synthase [Frankia sp. AgB32]|uniref:COX15/CtaA family protein n=1 Tax=Frankia sp. AgB32 TaxID=631119 RepID=UPI00200C0E42|nr:COX15/CtaA family protein [Frankia sp. AgB32]MCK9896409.1 COX15/CtaA family protein [Frankia sp. AgB32]
MTSVPASTARRRLPLVGRRAFQLVTALNVVLLSLIVVSGGAVRLTGSGLGCPTWPQCGDGSFTPHSEYALHGVIEFGNRVVGLVVGVVVLITPLMALRLRGGRRRDLTRLSFGLWIGYLGQAVLGGITVLTKLHPATVAAHFLLSMVLLWNAVALDRRARQGAGPATAAVAPPLLWLARLLVVASAAVLVLGTVVTGTGPHSGDATHVARFGFDITTVAQLHADGAMLLTGLVAAMVFAVRVSAAPPAARRASLILLVVIVSQAGIGFAQYFLGIPSGLVALHMTGATVMWVVALSLWLAMSTRPAIETDTPLAQPTPTISSTPAKQPRTTAQPIPATQSARTQPRRTTDETAGRPGRSARVGRTQPTR